MTILFSSERCIIKCPVISDAPYWQRLKSIPNSKIKNIIEKNILHYTHFGFCIGSIFLKRSKTFLGIAGLTFYPNGPQENGPELSIVLSPGFRKQGYGREITRTMIHWFFSQGLFTRVSALVLIVNQKSWQLLDNLGMTNQGIVSINNQQYYLYTITVDKACDYQMGNLGCLNELD